ncbi:hypothetical protein Curi_c23430 [Gottschalkia acidurici 9a]|uniref:Lipoprotein n=1 Tax=Gottschalkia acidurici (strain ATCC 7906 / DSM 604 / BCRC 14475 / CIP 104303 / KCTC 5404 / NCIMB 10678 / 9a) TaxID=1128398 RepID=K0B391_GOTA9|nr:hypothetical protein [Gottschalkia acidurici]AFS79345.1 hypothetical protein Curi_c23430 [Gottschalkia acidurici 9a]
MKKYKIIFTSCILCILILTITGCSSVGSINGNYISSISQNSVVSFNGEKEDIIQITYDVTVEEGTLKIQIKNSDGNIIEDFEVNKSGNKEVQIEDEDEYELSAILEDFKGKFKINAKK